MDETILMGLVEKDGKYHIHYQYSYEPEGGLKYWKQFTTKRFPSLSG